MIQSVAKHEHDVSLLQKPSILFIYLLCFFFNSDRKVKMELSVPVHV